MKPQPNVLRDADDKNEDKQIASIKKIPKLFWLNIGKIILIAWMGTFKLLWICRPLIEQTDALTMYNVFYLRLGSTSIGHARHVQTRNDKGLRLRIFSQKLPFSVGKKCFKYKFRKYNTLYLYVINQIFPTLSCGSMKSVSSFSSIDDI